MHIVKREKPKPEYFLDYVLEVMEDWERENLNSQTPNNMTTIIGNEGVNAIYFDFSNNLLKTIIDKLEKDNYISYDNKTAEFNDRQYYLTFEGQLFKNNGGYQTQVIQNNQSALRQRWIYRWTVVLAIGTLIAAIYYGMEIANHFCGFYNH